MSSVMPLCHQSGTVQPIRAVPTIIPKLESLIFAKSVRAAILPSIRRNVAEFRPITAPAAPKVTLAQRPALRTSCRIRLN
jgi:hypothetical protein